MRVQNTLQDMASQKKIIKGISWLTLVLLFIYLAISVFLKTHTPSILFDDAWIAAINYLPFSKYIAGSDYIFTYGPLYFLNVCLNVEPNKLLTQLFYFFEHLSVAWVLFLYFRAMPPAKFSIFAIALIVSQFLNHNDFRAPSGSEYIPIIVLVLFLYVPLIASAKSAIFSSILAGIYAAILMFIKFDLAIEVVITIVVYFLLAKPFRIIYPKAAYSLFIFAWLGALLFLGAIVFKSPANCFNWISTNGEHILLYTEAADLPPPSLFFPIAAAMSILIYTAVIFRDFANRNILTYIGITLLPSIILLFKHGFILAEFSHMQSFYKYMLVVIAFSFVFSKKKSDLIWLLIPFMCLIPIVSVLDYVQDYWSREINYSSRTASLKLSDSFLPVDKQTKAFDAVPYNMMWCFINNLPYRPSPFIVLYHAATRERDREAAQYFLGLKAPDYLFCEHSACYRRNMFVETPLAWSSILNRYTIKEYDSSKYLLLLQKKYQYVLPNLVNDGQLDGNANEWLKVPTSKNPIYCQCQLHPNLLGILSRWFYKLPSISMNLKYSDGHMQNFKLVPGVLKNGILINYMPEDMPALKLLFEGKAAEEVTQIQLTGPGVAYYHFPVNISWIKESNKVIDVQESQINMPQLLDLPVGKFSIANASIYSPRQDYTDYNAALSSPIFIVGDDDLLSIVLMVYEEDRSILPTAVYMQIDNGPLIKTAQGIKLVERGISLPTREAMLAGFMTAINIRNLKPGLHKVQAIARSRKDGKWYRVSKAAEFLLR